MHVIAQGPGFPRRIVHMIAQIIGFPKEFGHAMDFLGNLRMGELMAQDFLHCECDFVGDFRMP